MTALQNQYWQTRESIRHNKRDEEINQQNADTNVQNAYTNMRNAKTNERNADANWYNAQSNRTQALAASSNAAVNKAKQTSEITRNYYSALESANKASEIAISAKANAGKFGDFGGSFSTKGISAAKTNLERSMSKALGYSYGEARSSQAKSSGATKKQPVNKNVAKKFKHH